MYHSLVLQLSWHKMYVGLIRMGKYLKGVEINSLRSKKPKQIKNCTQKIYPIAQWYNQESFKGVQDPVAQASSPLCCLSLIHALISNDDNCPNIHCEVLLGVWQALSNFLIPSQRISSIQTRSHFQSGRQPSRSLCSYPLPTYIGTFLPVSQDCALPISPWTVTREV